jgi:hypothetical protein
MTLSSLGDNYETTIDDPYDARVMIAPNQVETHWLRNSEQQFLNRPAKRF